MCQCICGNRINCVHYLAVIFFFSCLFTFMLSPCHLLRRRPKLLESPFRTGKAKGFVAKNNTGSVFFKRQNFDFNWKHKRMYKRISGAPDCSNESNPRSRYLHLGGDVLLPPLVSYALNKRKDGLMHTWRARHRLQLHLFSSTEIFVCFHCGYPVKSALVAVKEENWDYRMCYNCYKKVLGDGLADVI